MNTELQGYLLGNASQNVWFAALIAAGFTGLIMNIYRISRGVKSNPVSPPKFNLWYFLKDTGLRLICTIGLLLISLRLVFIFKLDVGWAIGFAILLGILSDRIGKILTRVGDKGEQLANDKMDEIVDKLKTTQAQVKVTAAKIDTVQDDVTEIKSDVKDMKHDE